VPELSALTWDSLAERPVPSWYQDAKLGVMIHWGPYAVAEDEEPASAETLDVISRHWGRRGHYDDLIRTFRQGLRDWDPADTLAAVAASGARYLIVSAKHHDGFALWPARAKNPRKRGWQVTRDVVGELAGGARARGLKFGLYYSAGLDGTFSDIPNNGLADLAGVIPHTRSYTSFVDAQWRELISRYSPSILWNDVGSPASQDLLALFSEFYEAVPDGVINDRFTLLPGQTHHDYITPEFTVLTDISAEKFETVRGMGRGFGYNQNESDADLDSGETLVRLLVDVVSKNGNLLLNVGPKADGSIPPEQLSRLQVIGAWLDVNGAAIFGTRPWTHAAGVTADATPLRFTAAADGRTVYAIVLGTVGAGELTLKDLAFKPKAVRLLGTAGRVPASVSGADLRLTLRAAPPAEPAYVFALTVR
jgi:alpha-L-fucosidase